MKKLIQYLIAFIFTLNLFSIFGSASAKEKLKPSDYKMNTAYTYVYDHSEKYIFREKVGSEYFWKKYLKSKKKYEYNIDLCEHATSSILEDCSVGGGTVYLKKTIKKGYSWKFIWPGDDRRTVQTLKITNTNSIVKTKARTFKHVVIVKSTSKYHVSYFYYAKGYGLIKSKNKYGDEKQYYTYELTQLTKSKTKATKELKSIKKYAKSGKTPQTKTVKIGDTINTGKKILGKPKNIDYYRVSVIYEYSNNRSLWFKDMKKKNILVL